MLYFKAMPNSVDFYKGIFLHVIPVCIIVPCLKVVSATFLLVCFLNLNESTYQTKKNVFYFTSKALFILKKIKF